MKIFSAATGSFSALILLVSACAYSFRPDYLAAATFFPAWIWMLVGLLLAMVALFRTRRFGLQLLIGWLVFGSIFVEELHSCGRTFITSSGLDDRLKKRDGSLVVVSMNCVGGINAVRDLKQFQPDILLLQERPGDVDELHDFAKELFGDAAVVAVGADTAVIASGTPMSTTTSDSVQRYLAQVTIRTNTERELSIYSIRLQPPQIDTNILSTECWTAHWKDRVVRREQLQRAVDEYKDLPVDQAVLFGGDFNVAAHDGSLRPLQTRLRDAFRTAGFGLGNTATNDLPLFRIDQLWHSPTLKPVLITAVKSNHSDHRIVVGLFRW